VTEVLDRNDLEEPYLDEGDVDCTPYLRRVILIAHHVWRRVMLIAHHIWRRVVLIAHHIWRRVMLIAHHIYCVPLSELCLSFCLAVCSQSYHHSSKKSLVSND